MIVYKILKSIIILIAFSATTLYGEVDRNKVLQILKAAKAKKTVSIDTRVLNNDIQNQTSSPTQTTPPPSAGLAYGTLPQLPPSSQLLRYRYQKKPKRNFTTRILPHTQQLQNNPVAQDINF